MSVLFHSACLIACLKKENKSQSVVKLVATNLIASGDTQLGVQLLCVIHKALDACRYLQSNGQWDKSVWLAKVSTYFPHFSTRVTEALYLKTRHSSQFSILP